MAKNEEKKVARGNSDGFVSVFVVKALSWYVPPAPDVVSYACANQRAPVYLSCR